MRRRLYKSFLLFILDRRKYRWREEYRIFINGFVFPVYLFNFDSSFYVSLRKDTLATDNFKFNYKMLNINNYFFDQSAKDYSLEIKIFHLKPFLPIQIYVHTYLHTYATS